MEALGGRGFLVYGLRLSKPPALIYANFYLAEEAALRDIENIIDHEAPGWDFDAYGRYIVNDHRGRYAYSIAELGPSKLISSPILLPPMESTARPMESPRLHHPDV